MRKAFRRGTALLLGAALCASLAACGGGSNTTTTTASGEQGGSESTGEVTKPEKLKVMFDGTVFTTANGRDQFEAALEEALGMELEFVQPDHSAYYDNVSMTFAGGDIPDIILLGSSYYWSYASQGALWDMSSAWENSELKASGRIINEDIINGLYLDGALYGFAPSRGNGCVTYLKKKWLDNVGLEVPTTYDEYMNVLKAFTEGDPDGNGVNGDTYAITASGLIGAEAPYTNFLPEFYQDAYPDFYKNDEGVWVDGFSEDAMIGAMTRLKDAYSKGYIDKEIITNKTSDCRNKFYDDKCGVFTYWAGTWANNLKTNLEAKGLDGELVIVPPIEELGHYVERTAANVWCITANCSNPEGAFKYFIEPMLDGGEVQTLWSYGVKGVHWDDKAETVTYGDNSETYEEGQFHMLPNLETPTTLNTKNHIDPMLAIATFDGEDPGASTVAEIAKESQEKFNEWAVQAHTSPNYDEVYNTYIATLNDIRKPIITEVVTGSMTPEDGVAQYKEQAASMVEEILESLNAQ
ncbi:MAG: extracellular solute-binding protein [bacterium]|nr:extracellular solute-binding protein [bacterium]